MSVHTQPRKLGISLLLAAFLNSACALSHQLGQPQLHSPGSSPRADAASTPATAARISPEAAVTRAVNTLTPTEEGYHLRHPHYTATFKPDGVTFQPQREKVRWQWHLQEVGTTAGPLAEVNTSEVRPEQGAAQTVVYRRGVLDEQYVARKNSIEQQFVIPQPLALQGADLRIRGQVQSGGALESRDAHWVWQGKDQGIWLGQVYVYDAQGTEVPSKLEVEQDETTIVIDGRALARAVYPVVVDPEIGVNDFRISDMGPDGDPDYSALNSAVAYNSTNHEYLVVWKGDDESQYYDASVPKIFGQRLVGATGVDIGTKDFRIADTSYSSQPAVAYNSTNNEYLVVWEGVNITGGIDVHELEIHGQRLAGATGVEVGANDFRISDMGPDGASEFDAQVPAVAYSGTNNEYFVLWSGNDTIDAPSDGGGEDFEIYGQ